MSHAVIPRPVEFCLRTWVSDDARWDSKISMDRLLIGEVCDNARISGYIPIEGARVRWYLNTDPAASLFNKSWTARASVYAFPSNMGTRATRTVTGVHVPSAR